MDAPTPSQVVELALECLGDRGVEVTVTDEGLTTDDGKVFGLEPLRRRLSPLPAEEWAEAVRSHFDLVLAATPEMPATFEEASPNLRSAVVAEADLGLFEGAIMERPLVDGLGERLMLKRGALGMTVTRETVDRWDVDHDGVWKRARDGSLWDETVQRDGFWIGAGPTYYTAVRGGRWTSTRVLDLGRFLKGAPRFGALVTVPARDEILIHQIRDDAFTDAALAMLSHTAASYVESPLPVGCDLFWWDDGRLSRICTPAEDRYRYIRVPEFSAMLWRLEETISQTCDWTPRRA
ncbi:MAG TPA: hypothetical protein VHL52_05005 [Acidimicrobiia bacterium]|nr:hypothetical protein [Acidimicrobiia bacterium]